MEENSQNIQNKKGRQIRIEWEGRQHRISLTDRINTTPLSRFKGHRYNERLDFSFAKRDDDYLSDGSFWDWEQLPSHNPLLLERMGFQLLKYRDAYDEAKIDVDLSTDKEGFIDKNELSEQTKKILSIAPYGDLSYYARLSHSYSFVYIHCENVLQEAFGRADSDLISHFHLRHFLVTYESEINALFRATGLFSDNIIKGQVVPKVIEETFERGVALLVRRMKQENPELFNKKGDGESLFLANLTEINYPSWNTTPFRHLCERALPERIYLDTLIFPRYSSRCFKDDAHYEWFKTLPSVDVDMFGDIAVSEYEYDLEDWYSDPYLGSHLALPILPQSVIDYYFEGETREKLSYFLQLAMKELNFDPKVLLEERERKEEEEEFYEEDKDEFEDDDDADTREDDEVDEDNDARDDDDKPVLSELELLHSPWITDDTDEPL